MDDGQTIEVGYVHVLYAHGAGCVPHCPHPDHYAPSSAVGPALDWMPPRSPNPQRDEAQTGRQGNEGS